MFTVKPPIDGLPLIASPAATMAASASGYEAINELMGTLEPIELQTGYQVFSQTTALLERTGRLPSVVYFDFDEILFNQQDNRFMGRGIGMLSAFVYAKVPVGLFTFRPADSMQKMFSQHPKMAWIFLQNPDEILTREDAMRWYEEPQICAPSYQIKYREFYSKKDPSVVVLFPTIEIEGQNELEHISVPKLLSKNRAILIDDKDWTATIGSLQLFLGKKLDLMTSFDPLAVAARRTLSGFVHIPFVREPSPLSRSDLASIAHAIERISRP